MYHFKEKSIFKEKNIFNENKGKQPQKNEVGKVGGGKRLKASRSEWTGGSRKRVKVTNKDEKKVPVISSSGEFVGKLIDQFLDDGDVESWHKGVVLKCLAEEIFWLDIMIALINYIHNHYLKNLRSEILELLNGERRSCWCEYLSYASI